MNGSTEMHRWKNLRIIVNEFTFLCLLPACHPLSPIMFLLYVFRSMQSESPQIICVPTPASASALAIFTMKMSLLTIGICGLLFLFCFWTFRFRPSNNEHYYVLRIRKQTVARRYLHFKIFFIIRTFNFCWWIIQKFVQCSAFGYTVVGFEIFLSVESI